MGATLKITCADHTSAELRALAGKCTDGAQVRRMLALALVLEGRSRSEAAALNGMDRQTLRDWVHRYNASGMAGLKSRQSPGREPYLTEQQLAELRDLVIRGPDPAIDRVVRWRCVDLRAEVARRFSVEVHESTIGKWLHQLAQRIVSLRTRAEARILIGRRIIYLLVGASASPASVPTGAGLCLCGVLCSSLSSDVVLLSIAPKGCRYGFLQREAPS